MIEKDYLNVLQKIYVRLNNSNVNWAITGSFSFALQGIPIEVHDIDIQTDKTGAYEIECQFPDVLVKKVMFSSADKIRSYFGALMINGIKVEIMGDIQKRLGDGIWEEPVDLKLHRRFIEIGKMRIPVLSLEYEYQAYLKLGRIDKAKILRNWLYSKHKFLGNASPDK